METLKNNKKTAAIGAGVGLAATGGTLYALSKKNKQ